MHELPHIITYVLAGIALILIGRNTSTVLKRVKISGHIRFLILTGLVLQTLTIFSFLHNHYYTWFLEGFEPHEIRRILWIGSHYLHMLFQIVVGCVLGAHLNFRAYSKRRRLNDI